MRIISPVVLKIGETKLDLEGMYAMLKHFGVSNDAMAAFDSKAIQYGPQTLIELAGRMCYRSFEPGLNPNVTKVRKDSADYFENIIKSGDGSILEHVQVNFAFLNVSRVLTHELVRHRVGVAISQESLRYVRPKEIGLWLPDTLTTEQRLKIEAAVEQIEGLYRDIEATVDWDSLPFGKKKELTSAMRRILPDGMATNIIWSANLRTLRHVISMRTDPAAEIEIRIVFGKVAEICIRDYPLVFKDFVSTDLPDGTKSWKPTLREKV